MTPAMNDVNLASHYNRFINNKKEWEKGIPLFRLVKHFRGMFRRYLSGRKTPTLAQHGNMEHIYVTMVCTMYGCCTTAI